MSIWVIHFQDGNAHIVVDSVASAKPMPSSNNEYPSSYTAKLRAFPHFGCVAFGRGDCFFMSMMELTINRLPILDFDDLVDNFKNIISVAELHGDVYCREGVAPRMYKTQELVMVGYSRREKRVVAAVAVRENEGEQYKTCVIKSGTFCMTPVPGIDGNQNLKLRNIEVELSGIARRQLNEAFRDESAREGNQAGGHMVHCCVSKAGISTKVIGLHSNADEVHRQISGLPERKFVLYGV